MVKLSEGTKHKIPKDLRDALTSSKKLGEIWNGLTPIARNEWICWTVSVKKSETRKDHVRRVKSELLEGMRRPCCWIGCVHRIDKPMSHSQKYILRKK